MRATAVRHVLTMIGVAGSWCQGMGEISVLVVVVF
jgi:hypothetical protein